MKISLKSKMVLSIFISICIVGSISVYYVFTSVKSTLIGVEKDRLEYRISSISNSIEYTMNDSFDFIKRVATLEHVVGYLNDDSQFSDVEMASILESSNVNDRYLAVYLLNTNGDTVASTDYRFVNKNYGFRKYFEEAMLGNTTVDVNRGVTSGELGYYFSSPIISNGAIVGVAVAKLNPDDLERSVFYDKKIKGGNIVVDITDRFGVIIFSTNNKRIFSSYKQFANEETEFIEKYRRYDGIDINVLDNDDLYSLIKSGSSDVIRYIDIEDNKEELATVRSFDTFPFFIVTEEDITPIVDNANRVAGSLALFIALAVLIASFISVFLISRLLKPLYVLKSIATSIAQGNISKRALITSGDELEDLAMLFNKMATSLSKYSEDLENKVKEQTSKLEAQTIKTNQILKGTEKDKEEVERLNEAMTGRELKMVELKKEIEELKKGRK